MKLYETNLSPNCLRVRAVIYELELPVELVEVDIRAPSAKPAEFLAANPNGKVPAFVDDDGFALFESRAITGYLASKRPERDLYPQDLRRRVLVDQWSYWEAIHLGPPMRAVAFERVVKPMLGRGEADEAVVAAKLAEVGRYLPVLDAALEGREWLVDALSLADLSLASSFIFREASGVPLDHVPHVDAWIRRVEALPSWQRALPQL